MKLNRRLPLLALLTYLFFAHSLLMAERQGGSPASWIQIVQTTTGAIAVIETDTSLGSGFFINGNGTLVTNNHVIAGANGITVKLSNGETYRRAYLLAADQQRDIAILRIEAADLTTIPLGNSNDVKSGEEVLLIGAPRGLEQTISNGFPPDVLGLLQSARAPASMPVPVQQWR